MGAFDNIKKPAPVPTPTVASPPAAETVEVPVGVPVPVEAVPVPARRKAPKEVTPPLVYSQPIGPEPMPALSTLTPEQVMAASPVELQRAQKAEAGQLMLPEAPAALPEPVRRLDKPGFHMPVPFAGGPTAPVHEEESEAARMKRLVDAAREPGIRQQAQTLLNDKGMAGILTDPRNRQLMPDQLVLKWRAAVKLRHPEMTDAQAQEKAWRDMAALRTVGVWTGVGPLSPMDADPNSLVDAGKPHADVIGIDRFGVPITRLQRPESYGIDLLMSPGTLAVASGVPDVLAQTYLGETRDPATEKRIFDDVDLGSFNPKTVRERRSFSDVVKDTDQSQYPERALHVINDVRRSTGHDAVELTPLGHDVLEYGARGTAATLGAAGDVFTPDPATVVAAPLIGGLTLAGKVVSYSDKALEAARIGRALEESEGLWATAERVRGNIHAAPAGETGAAIRSAAEDYEKAATRLGKQSPLVAGAVEDAALASASKTGGKAPAYIRSVQEAAALAKEGKGSVSRVGDSLRLIADAVDEGRLGEQEARALTDTLMDSTQRTAQDLARGMRESSLLPKAPKSAAIHLLDALQEGSPAYAQLAKAKATLDTAEAQWAATNKVSATVLEKLGLAETKGGQLRLVNAPVTAGEKRAVEGVIRAQTKGVQALRSARETAAQAVLKAADKGIVLTQPEAQALRSSMTTQMSSYTYALADKVDPLRASVDALSSAEPITSAQLAAADSSLRRAGVETRRGLGAKAMALQDPETARSLFTSKVGRASYRSAIVQRAQRVLDVVKVPLLGIDPLSEWERAHLSADMRDMALRSERLIARIGADISRLNTIEEVADYLSGVDRSLNGRPLATSGSSFVQDFAMLAASGGAEYDAVLHRLVRTLTEGAGGGALGEEAVTRAVTELRAAVDGSILPLYERMGVTAGDEAAGVQAAYDRLLDPTTSPELAKMVRGMDPGVRARTFGGWVAAETQLNREVRRLFAEGAALTKDESQAMLAIGEGTFAPPLRGAHNDVSLMLSARRYFTPGTELEPVRFIEAVDKREGLMAAIHGRKPQVADIPAVEGDTVAGIPLADSRATEVMSPRETRAAAEGYATYGREGPAPVYHPSAADVARENAERAAQGLKPKPSPTLGKNMRARFPALDEATDPGVLPGELTEELDQLTSLGAEQPWLERAKKVPYEESGFPAKDVRTLEENIAFLPAHVRARLAAAVADVYKPRVPTGWGNMLTAWKLAQTRGAIGVRPKYFLDNYFGDIEQIYAAFGLNTAVKQAQRTAATAALATVPSGLLRMVGGAPLELGGNALMSWFVGGERGSQLFAKLAAASQDTSEALGRFLSLGSMRVETSSIIEGASNKVIRVGSHAYTARELREIAVRGGVFDTRNADVAMHADGTFWASVKEKAAALGIGGRRLSHGVEEIAETIGLRQRVGLYSSLIEEGMLPEDAARGVVKALYDYKYTVTAAEKSGILQFVIPFWAYQKNANRQFLGALMSPRGMYRIKTFLAGRKVTRELLQQLATSVNKEDGDDVGVLGGRIPDGDPAQEAYVKFNALRKRVGPGVTTLQWNKLLTSGTTSWGGTDLTVDDIILLREWTVPFYNQGLHDAYARGREAVDVGIVDNTGPVGRRQLLSKENANPDADDNALMPDVDTYWEVLYPPSSAESALGWSLTGLGVVLTTVSATIHPEQTVNPLTVAQQVVDPTRAPFLGPVIGGLTNTSKPVRISKGLGSALLSTMPFLTESVVPLPAYKGSATRDQFYSEEYLRALRSPDPQVRDAAKDMAPYDAQRVGGYEVSGAMAMALQSSGLASLVDRAYKFQDTDEAYAPDRLRSFLAGMGFATQFVSQEQEPSEGYRAEYQQMQEKLPQAEFSPAAPK